MFGQMANFTKDSGLVGKNKALECGGAQKVTLILGSGKEEKQMVMVSIPGSMGTAMKDNSRTV